MTSMKEKIAFMTCNRKLKWNFIKFLYSKHEVVWNTDAKVEKVHSKMPYPVKIRCFCASGIIISKYFCKSNGIFSHSVKYNSLDNAYI